MQTMAITQRKNIQYFSVGYSVTSFPLMPSLLSLSRKEQRSSSLWPAPLLSFLLQSLQMQWTLNCSLAHTDGPLAFITNFSSLWKFLSESCVPYYTVLPAPLTMVWYQIKNCRQFHKSLCLWDLQMSSFFPYSVEKQLHRMSLNGLQELVDQNISYGLDNFFSYFHSTSRTATSWSWVSIYMIKIGGTKCLLLDETSQELWGKNNSYKLHLLYLYFYNKY